MRALRSANVTGSSRCQRCYDVLNPGGTNAYLWATAGKVTLNGILSWSQFTGADSDRSCGCNVGAWMSPFSQCSACGKGFALEWAALL